MLHSNTYVMHVSSLVYENIILIFLRLLRRFLCY